MVRRNELACRDEWSRSLWQPVGGSNANGATPFERPLSAGPLPPTQPENLRTLLNKDADYPATSQGEDVLLSEARIVSESHEPWEPSVPPLPSGNFDPRTAIFRARAAYRERVRAKSAAERQSGVAEATDTDRPSTGESQPQINRLVNGATGPQEIPDEMVLAKSTVTFQSPEPDNSRSDPAPSEFSVGNDDLQRWADLYGQQPQGSGRGLPIDSEVDSPGPEKSGISSPEELPNISVAAEQAPEHVPGAARVCLDTEEDPLPEWFRSNFPRVCKSCRDYRPATDGQRGWCANAWAFTHRRLVDEDDVAPCQSAIGDWWTPVDDVWLVAADVASHGRATPLLDRLTGKQGPQRRRS